MRIKCGFTKAEQEYNLGVLQAKIAKLEAWHPHFSWLVTKVADGDCRWLEMIERRLVSHYLTSDGHIVYTVWRYRAVGSTRP